MWQQRRDGKGRARLRKGGGGTGGVIGRQPESPTTPTTGPVTQTTVSGLPTALHPLTNGHSRLARSTPDGQEGHNHFYRSFIRNCSNPVHVGAF